MQPLYRAALKSALEAGYAVLREGGEAMDAAVAAVTVMEDYPLFNSGKGAAFNAAGKNELESSIMLSKPPASHPDIPATRRGSALTLLTRTKNPSQLARAIYLSPELAPHTTLSGHEAESFGEKLGIEQVHPSYFFTEDRWMKHRRGLGLPDEPYPSGQTPSEAESWETLDQMKTGTVGAVALDCRGCIASVTSTGGGTNKVVGRIGDTAQMGAGFWAEEWKEKRRFFQRMTNKLLGRPQTRAIGVSATGMGDHFIRFATCSTIARRVRFGGESIKTAASACMEELRTNGGIGGVIVLDESGNYAMPLACEGMFRGVIKEDGEAKVAIFRDDVLA